jgi:hypothetical protein
MGANPMRQAGPLQVVARLWRRPDFVLAVLVGALALALAYYWLLLRVTTVHTMVSKLASQSLYLALLGGLAVIALVLFGLNVGLLGLLVRARTPVRGQGGSVVGILIGGFGVGCPSCGAFLLSLVGVSAGVSALPFAGLELWFIACLIMAFTFWRSLRSLHQGVCATPTSGETCPALAPVSHTHVALLAVVGLAVAGILLWTLAAGESVRFFPAM